MEDKLRIFEVTGNVFRPVDKFPSMKMEKANFSDIGMSDRLTYKFFKNWDTETFTILEQSPITRLPNGGLDGYRLMINGYAKLYKYNNRFFYVGGFTIL